MIHRPDSAITIDGTSNNPMNPDAEIARHKATIMKKTP